jgi:tRNA nucleotidyltransferase (CCA-adding enzyme)
MKVIATHLNADFDGFAAMIGLLKMHPEAVFVFPGSKEPGLRHFLRDTGMEIPEVPLKDVKNVSHLILVDASREDRIGELSSFLHLQPRPKVEIYDHHPDEQATLQGDVVHTANVGATTTIVVMELMQKIEAGEIESLSSFEASILLAGIYEDTANFLSIGTTPEDFRASLWLIEHGAEVPIVNRLLTHRLQPTQVAFFNELIARCETIHMEGTQVVLSMFSWSEFVPEAAYLVHRLMYLEPIDVFFALVLMDKRVHLIARSQLPDVDVGQIASSLGGGGHRMAASAVLKGMTLIEAREKLLSALYQNLVRREKASDLMKKNIIAVEESKTIFDAANLMNTFRVNALAVREMNRVIGTISRQIVDGAIFHGLQDRSVREFMVTEIPLIHPDTPARKIFDSMVSGRTRFVLVGRDPENVEGIITRMDLLRYQYELSPARMALRKGRQSENLSPMLHKRLPSRILEVLEKSGQVAEQLGMKAYLVGGMIRDLLLHRDTTDLDIVIEGDGIKFAEEFARIHGAQVASHPRFGTARVIFPDRFKIDVATARTESYHAPAALPQVHGGILRQDLYRRDFTINTLAIDLSSSNFGHLIDYFGGWDDLHQGVIRVLHSLSFVDDPTRTLRAIRFATRFNFRISQDTERLMKSAVDSRVLEKLTGKRLWSELRNLLQEEHPIPALRMLQQYKLLSFVHPAVEVDSFLLELLYRVESVLSWFSLNFPNEKIPHWKIYLMALLEKLNRADRMVVAQRFQLLAAVQEILRFYKSNCRDIFSRLKTGDNTSSLYFSLREYPLEVVLYAMARIEDQDYKQRIANYIRDLREIRLVINGDDLVQMGMKEGPEIRELLNEVLKAKLDGNAPNRDAQLQLAAGRLSRTR